MPIGIFPPTRNERRSVRNAVKRTRAPMWSRVARRPGRVCGPDAEARPAGPRVGTRTRSPALSGGRGARGRVVRGGQRRRSAGRACGGVRRALAGGAFGACWSPPGRRGVRSGAYPLPTYAYASRGSHGRRSPGPGPSCGRALTGRSPTARRALGNRHLAVIRRRRPVTRLRPRSRGGNPRSSSGSSVDPASVGRAGVRLTRSRCAGRRSGPLVRPGGGPPPGGYAPRCPLRRCAATGG